MSLVAIKIIIIAVNNCLDLYFHALIIEFFVICQISVQNLRKGHFKRGLLVCEGAWEVSIVVLPEGNE